jgi:hypothetical protein
VYIYFQADDFQLKCIVSDIDGNKYCVRDRTKLADAADLLARVTTKCKKLVDYMYDKYPDNGSSSDLNRITTQIKLWKLSDKHVYGV